MAKKGAVSVESLVALGAERLAALLIDAAASDPSPGKLRFRKTRPQVSVEAYSLNSSLCAPARMKTIAPPFPAESSTL
jgi:hypothetical protein